MTATRHPRTRRALVYQLLRDAGPRGVTTNDLLLAGVGSRYSARILELREVGYVIESQRLRDGQWRYTLTHEPGWRTTLLHDPAADQEGDDDQPQLFDAA
jgi:hypothetical protein